LHHTTTQVMSTRHTFVDRNALLMRAGAEAVTAADEQRLHRHGLRTHALQPKGQPLPGWLVKWAALVRREREREREAERQRERGRERVGERERGRGRGAEREWERERERERGRERV
jgi:hypothetical protein